MSASFQLPTCDSLFIKTKTETKYLATTLKVPTVLNNRNQPSSRYTFKFNFLKDGDVLKKDSHRYSKLNVGHRDPLWVANQLAIVNW